MEELCHELARLVRAVMRIGPWLLGLWILRIVLHLCGVGGGQSGGHIPSLR